MFCSVLHRLGPRQKEMALVLHAYAAEGSKNIVPGVSHHGETTDDEHWWHVEPYDYWVNFPMDHKHTIRNRDWIIHLDPSLAVNPYMFAETDDFDFFTRNLWDIYRPVVRVLAKDEMPEWLIPRLKLAHR